VLAAAGALACAGLLGGGATRAEAASPYLYGASTPTDVSASAFQRYAAGGMKTVRIQFYWASVEPAPGFRQWGSLDAVVGNAAKAGVSLLPLLYGTPGWVSQNNAAPPLTGGGRGAWARFLKDLAARYGTNGTFWTLNPTIPKLPIIDWQIWNEVNLEFYWGGKPSPPAYADLLHVSSDALHLGDPSARIITAGLLPYESVGGPSADRYMKQLLRQPGVRAWFDVVAVHPYGSSPRLVMLRLWEFRRALNKLKGKGLPLWATEWGWTTGGAGFNESPFRSSHRQQAQRLNKTFKSMAKDAKRLKLRRSFYFNIQDTNQAGVDSWNARMGMFELNGAPKQSWFAFVKRAGGTP
jgi:hypothetical protein